MCLLHRLLWHNLYNWSQRLKRDRHTVYGFPLQSPIRFFPASQYPKYTDRTFLLSVQTETTLHFDRFQRDILSHVLQNSFL